MEYIITKEEKQEYEIYLENKNKYLKEIKKTQINYNSFSIGFILAFISITIIWILYDYVFTRI